MTDTVTRAESGALCPDVTEIKDTLNDHVPGTLAEQGECPGGLEERVRRINIVLDRMRVDLRHVKDCLDAIKGHFGI